MGIRWRKGSTPCIGTVVDRGVPNPSFLRTGFRSDPFLLEKDSDRTPFPPTLQPSTSRQGGRRMGPIRFRGSVSKRERIPFGIGGRTPVSLLPPHPPSPRRKGARGFEGSTTPNLGLGPFSCSRRDPHRPPFPPNTHEPADRETWRPCEWRRSGLGSRGTKRCTTPGKEGSTRTYEGGNVPRKPRPKEEEPNQ